MTTTETETKVESPAATTNAEETLAETKETGKEQADKPAEPNSTPSSPTKKTDTLKPVVTVHKKDFENDVVYLYQLVRSPTIPSLSASSLSVENWLRINGIQYENIDHKLRYKSKRGQLPFVELNGKEIDGAENIIRELSNYFNKDLDEGLTDEQKTVSHAFESMLNNHTGWILRWWRYNHPQELLNAAQVDIKRTFNSRFPNSVLNFVFKYGFRKQLTEGVGSGLGHFSSDEVCESIKNDLKAISNFLGNQDYFFGKDPHLLDCIAFAHLAQFIYVPFGGIKEWLETEAPNLIALVDRIKAKYWSDWDEITSTLEMNTHLPKKEVPPEVAEAKAAEEAKKEEAEKKKQEKKRLAEEKKKEREEKKRKEKEEKEREKARKAEEAKKAAEEKAAKQAAEKAAAEAATTAESATKNEAPATDSAAADSKGQESAPNGAEAAANTTEATAAE